jgi:pimeloyl-ACP methyl ester carboxylesterase
MSALTKLFPVPTDCASISPHQKLTIPSKPDASISYSFFPSTKQPDATPKRLIVFINGLGLPASSWLPSISIFRENLKSCPAILTYDRFGQGLTASRDPVDGTPGKENGHDFQEVANDLHEIITTIATTKLGAKASDVEDRTLHLLLIGASIGVPILRLYTQHHPGIVAGAIFLDSNIPDVNYSDFLPDPDAPGSDPKTIVADDCTLAQYRGARERLAAMFDLKVKNAEGLDRSTGPALLPHADRPKLVGPEGKGPWFSVVGHDPVTFAEVGLEKMGTPKSLSMKFMTK